MRVAYNDSDDRAGLRGYVQFNKYTYIHTYIHTYSIAAGFSPITLLTKCYYLPSGNPFKCHKDILSLQPIIPPNKRFDTFPPVCVGCPEGLDVVVVVVVFILKTNRLLDHLAV